MLSGMCSFNTKGVWEKGLFLMARFRLLSISQRCQKRACGAGLTRSTLEHFWVSGDKFDNDKF